MPLNRKKIELILELSIYSLKAAFAHSWVTPSLGTEYECFVDHEMIYTRSIWLCLV